MDISTINDLIDELEKAEMSLSNIRNLSALYIVRNEKLDKTNQDAVTNELNDILPSYLKYIEIKRKYQMEEIGKEAVTSYLKSVCNEIKEFIKALYAGSDMPEERKLIKEMIREIQ